MLGGCRGLIEGARAIPPLKRGYADREIHAEVLNLASDASVLFDNHSMDTAKGVLQQKNLTVRHCIIESS